MSTTVSRDTSAVDTAPVTALQPSTGITLTTASFPSPYSSSDTWPLISVIVPVHNTGVYLLDAVKSVVAQSYPHLELIIVDDDSSDELTLNVLQAYEQVGVLTRDNIDQVTAAIERPLLPVQGKQPQEIAAVNEALQSSDALSNVEVQVLRNTVSQGPGAGRNIGVNASKGEYFLFLDSDDVLAPQVIARVYETICTTGVDVVCFASHNFSYDPDYDLSRESTLWTLPEKTPLSCEDIIKQQQFFKVSCTAWGKLFKSSTYLAQKISFTPQVLFEDKDWVLRLLLHTKNIFYLPYDGYWRLLRPDSITGGDARTKRLLDLAAAFVRCVAAFQDSPYFSHVRNTLIEHIVSVYDYRVKDINNTSQLLPVRRELFLRSVDALAMLGVKVSKQPTLFYEWWHHLGYKLPWLSADARMNHFAAARMSRLYRRFCK